MHWSTECPAGPVFMLSMSLSAWRIGMKGHRAGSAFLCLQKGSLPSTVGDQVLQGVRSGLLWRIGGEERPSPSPLLSSPHLKYRLRNLSLEIQCSFHRPHITIVEEAAGGFSNSLNAKISYTPLLANADFLIVSAAGLNLY